MEGGEIIKKRGYWVFLGVMVLVGALLLNLNLQKHSPVVPDVNAQMQYSSDAMMGSYEYNTPLMAWVVLWGLMALTTWVMFHLMEIHPSAILFR